MPDAQRQQRHDHGEKRQTVEPEACGDAERGKCRTCDKRSDHAREIELNRVQRDRIGQMLFVDEQREQRLVSWTAERLRHPCDDRQREDMPDADDVPVDERGQGECGRHLDVLRHQQELPPVASIRDDAADQREEQDGGFTEERIEPEIESRCRAGDRQHEPVLRHLLHPRADARGERTGPQHAKVAIVERGRETTQRSDRQRRVGSAGNGNGWGGHDAERSYRLLRGCSFAIFSPSANVWRKVLWLPSKPPCGLESSIPR